jgi:hypothetical protein
MIPVIRINGGGKETREIIGGSFDGQIALVQGEDHLFLHTGPVRDVMVHESSMVNKYLVASRICHLTYGSELDIVVCRASVTPENGVINHTAIADVYTSGTSVSATVVGHVGTYTVIGGYRRVVNRTSLYEVNTSGFGGRGVVIDNTSG